MGDVIDIERSGQSENDERAEVERRTLIRAGWKPRVRCDQTVWKRPESGFYYEQSVALAIVETEGKEDS